MIKEMIDIAGQLYQLWFPLSIGFLFVIIIKDRKQLDIKLDFVAKFIAFMFILMFIKICLWNGQYVEPSKKVSMSSFLFVFLEDVFFTMTPFYICKLLKNKYLKFLVWTFFSALFAVGHIYLSPVWACVTLLYPYFISNRYAKVSSFGTVMVCHFLYDCFVTVLPKINNLLAI